MMADCLIVLLIICVFRHLLFFLCRVRIKEKLVAPTPTSLSMDATRLSTVRSSSSSSY